MNRGTLRGVWQRVVKVVRIIAGIDRQGIPMRVSRNVVSIGLTPGWNLVSLPFQPPNPAINAVINASHPADIVMTHDSEKQVWLVSRRDAMTGLFRGDIAVMTASTAYFIQTGTGQGLSLLPPAPVATQAAPPAIPIPIIHVAQGWNLVPVVSMQFPPPTTISADEYLGTLGVGGWLKALTFNPVEGVWESVNPQSNGKMKTGKGYWLYTPNAGVIIP